MEGVDEENKKQENASGSNDQKSETSNKSPREHSDETGTVFKKYYIPYRLNNRRIVSSLKLQRFELE